MARPSKRGSIFHLRLRVPKDLKDKAPGLKITLPKEAGGPRTITVGNKEINVTLRAREPSAAKLRHAAGLAYVERFFQALRDGPRPLSRKQIVGLAGVVYRAFAEGLEDDPGDASIWERAKQLNQEAADGKDGFAPLMIGSEAEKRKHSLASRYGVFADWVLSKHAIVTDDDSREALIEEIHKALNQAADKLQRNAEGDYRRDPNAARFPQLPAQPRANPTVTVTLTSLLEGWNREAKPREHTFKSYQKVVATFTKLIGHDDASRVTKADVLRFKDKRLATVSSKTVRDHDLAALKVAFSWGVANGKITSNPAAGVTVKVKRRRIRSSSFSPEEAKAILTACLSLKREGRESEWIYNAKRWAPFICAYTGARIGEVCQLRKQDIRKEGGLWTLHLTPEAGNIKTDQARTVVMHSHLVELGLPAFAERAKSKGHLFMRRGSKGALAPYKGPRAVANKVAEFIRTIVPDPHVQPNHAWRHSFKTVGIEAGISTRVLDAIEGHAPRSVGEGYGEVSLKAQAAAMAKFPRYL
jgi:integrase